MALNSISLKMIEPYFVGSVLSLGYPQLQGIDGRIEDLIANKGGTFSCVDLFKHEGCETVCDLNQAVEFFPHDLVIDPGTIEHCMNIGQALINAASAVRVGGRIFHGSPMTMLNHGFYNICPTLFGSFYELNGFKIEILEARNRRGEGDIIPIRLHARFGGDADSGLYCLAKRIEDRVFTFPTQAKYVRH